MWCTCVGGGRRGFKRIDKDLWGCEECGKPTIQVFKSLTEMKAPIGAIALISVHCRKDGINQITFALEGGERKTVLEVAGNPAVLERLWNELDTTTDSIMNLATLPEVDHKAMNELRVRARTQAETLVMFMYPFFNNVEEVSREAKARWDARRRGVEHVTPGIAGEEYVPPRRVGSADNGAEEQEPSSRRSNRSSRSRSEKTLPTDAVPNIKAAVESGMFTVEQISKSYGVPISQVRSQLGLD